MHDGPHEAARRQVDGGVARCRCRRLARRHRLSGEHTLVALELVYVRQADVGGDEIADLQADPVARHELAHVDALLPAVAPHERLVADVRMQGRDRELRPVLVDEPEPDAQGDDEGDDRTVDGVAGQRRDRRRGEQEDEERVAELTGEHAPRRHPVGRQDVRAEGGTATVGVGGAEPGVAHTEGVVDLLD